MALCVSESVWPKCFTTGVVSEDSDPRLLCADSLMAWALVLSGIKPPETFGKVLVEIGSRLGIITTYENLMKYSERFIAEWEK